MELFVKVMFWVFVTSASADVLLVLLQGPSAFQNKAKFVDFGLKVVGAC